MKKSIYNTAISVKSQEQANRLKQICIDYGLPYWDDPIAFVWDSETNVFGFDDAYNYGDDEFFIFKGNGNDLSGKTLITESEFLELLKQMKET